MCRMIFFFLPSKTRACVSAEAPVDNSVRPLWFSQSRDVDWAATLSELFLRPHGLDTSGPRPVCLCCMTDGRDSIRFYRMTPKTTSLHKAPLPPPLPTCRPAPSVFLHCFAFSPLLFIFFSQRPHSQLYQQPSGQHSEAQNCKQVQALHLHRF